MSGVRALFVCLWLALWVAQSDAVAVACCDVNNIRTAATSASSLVLASGRFTGSCSPSISFAIAGTSMTGAADGSTIIDCGNTGPVLDLTSPGSPFPSSQISNITFTNGRSATSGGVISATNVSLVLQNLTFTSTQATVNGGAVYQDFIQRPGGRLEISGCNFTGTSAGSGGGAVFTRADVTIVDRSSFTLNSANHGSVTVNGAVNGVGATSVSVTNSYFAYNALNNHGSLNIIAPGLTSITVDHCTFTNNVAGDSAAILVYPPSSGPVQTVTISNIVVTGNVGFSDAAVIVNNAGALTMSDATLVGNVGTNGTAGLSMQKVTTATLLRVNMTANNGTATFSTTATITTLSITGSYISRNLGGYGLFVGVTNSFSMDSTTVQQHDSRFPGLARAAIVLVGTSISTTATITNSLFSRNSAAGCESGYCGNHLYVGQVGNVTISDTQFNGDPTFNAGVFGGVQMYAASVILRRSSFVGNQIAADGSAMLIGGAFNANDAVVDSCVFANNIHNYGTLAIYYPTSYLSRNCTFRGNSARPTMRGGGEFLWGRNTPAMIVNNTYVDNTAPDGGGIYNGGIFLTVVGSTFLRGQCTNGCGYYGASYNISQGVGQAPLGYPASASFTDCVFANSSATGASSLGAAICSNEKSTLSVNRCSFSYGYAAYSGGAISTIGISAVINASTFYANTAGAYSGSINLIDGTSTILDVSDCTFTLSSAGSSAGTLGLGRGTTTTLTRITIANCTTPSQGGGIIARGLSLVIRGAVFTDNTAYNGADICSSSVGTIVVYDTVSTRARVWNLGAFFSVDVNVDTNAMFVNVTVQDAVAVDRVLFNYDAGGRISATNCTFRRLTATYYTIFVICGTSNGITHTFTNVVFDTCSAPLDNRLFFMRTTTVLFDGCTFRNLYSPGNVFDIQNGTMSNTLMENVGSGLRNIVVAKVFNMNNVTFRGLTYQCRMFWLSVARSVWTNVSVDSASNGTILETIAPINITNGVFTRLNVTAGPVLHVVSTSTSHFTNVKFDTISTSGSLMDVSGPVTLTNGNFRAITSTTTGALISLTGLTDNRLTDVTMDNVTTGGIGVYSLSTLYLTRCVVTRFTSTKSTFTLDGITSAAYWSNVSMDTVTVTGGAPDFVVMSYVPLVRMDTVTVSNIHSLGGFFLDKNHTGSMRLSNSRFTQNKNIGSDLIALQKDLSIESSYFADNGGGACGATLSFGFHRLNITNTQFLRGLNGGTCGAAINVQNSPWVTITGSTFIANTGYHGAALSITFGSAATVTGSTFTSNVDTLGVTGGGAIYQDANTISVSDCSFAYNDPRSLVSSAPYFETNVWNVGGSCPSFPPGVYLPTGGGCPGYTGYACPVNCAPGFISSTNDSVLSCTGTGFTSSPCVPNIAWQSEFLAGNSNATAMILPSYGTKFVASATNLMGLRAGAVLLYDATSTTATTVLVFGGSGYNQGGYVQEAGNARKGVLLDDTWLINTNTSTPTFMWVAGSASSVAPTAPAYTSPGTPGARYGGAGWVSNGVAYMFGGYGVATGPMIARLACLWSISFTSLNTGWSYRAGNTAGNDAPVYATAAGVFSASNKPGARFGHAAWTMTGVPALRGVGFIYGGDGYATASLVGLLDDIWMINTTTSVTFAFRGLQQVNVAADYSSGMGGLSSSVSPGARSGHSVWSTGTVVFIYGGSGPFGAYSDMWSATYNASLGRLVWTWVLGSSTPNHAGVYGSCPSCFPAARSLASLVGMTPIILATITGWPQTMFLLGGTADVDATTGLATTVRSDVWELNAAVTPATASWIAGNVHPEFPVQFPPTGAGRTNWTTGPRAEALVWPDNQRPGAFYVLGGSAPYQDVTIAPGNDLWRISLPYEFRLLTDPAPFLQAGAVLAIRASLYRAGVASPTFNVPAASLNMTVTRPGVIPNYTLSTDGFVNGVLLVAFNGPISGTSASYMVSLSFLNGTFSTSLNVTLVCHPSCEGCTSGGPTACVTCAEGFFRDPVSGLCNPNCSTGYYYDRTSRVCVRCVTGCSSCLDGTLSCTCNTTASWGRGQENPTYCRVCDVKGGEYLNGQSCRPCDPVYSCLGGSDNVTCTAAGRSQCGLCSPSFYKSQQVPQTVCTQCGQCPGATWQRNACNATNNVDCPACSVCNQPETFTLASCSANADTVCANCTALPNCGYPITCASAGASRCQQCAQGYFLITHAGASDECHACDTCPDGTFQLLQCNFLANTTCQSCQTGCARCKGPGVSMRPTDNQCSACDEARGWLLNAAGDTCVTICGAGEYHRPSNGSEPAQCTACSTGCATCNGSGLLLAGSGMSGCFACDESTGVNYLLSEDGSACVADCRSGQFRDSTAVPLRCASCASHACDAGTYVACTDASTVFCEPCTAGCLTCTGPGLDLSDYCESCNSDGTPSYALDPNSGFCAPCITNCSKCGESISDCVTCASGYAGTPRCEPVCESEGCIGCYDPNACGLCMGEYQGLDCKQCSALASAGSVAPKCYPARQTDATATGSAMGVLCVLVLIVTVWILWRPLPIFHHGVQIIQTPSLHIPLSVDVVMTTRHISLALKPPVKVQSAYLEGPGFFKESFPLEPIDGSDNKNDLGRELTLTKTQMTTFISGHYRVDVVTDSGMGAITTSHQLRIPVRKNLNNLLAVVTIILDFIQLSAFVFGSSVPWWKNDPVPTALHYTLLILPPALNLWYYMFWALLVLALLFFVLVIVIKTGLDRKLSKCPGSKAILTPVYATFMPLVGTTLYLPIISVMLSVLSCSRPVTVDGAQYTANFDPTGVVCWTGDHWVFVALAGLVILLYYPAAVFTLPLWQTTAPHLDVRYFPNYLVVASQVKFLLAVSNQMFAAVTLVGPVLVIALPLIVVVMTATRPPTIIGDLRWLILDSYLCVSWSGVASLVALAFPGQWISALVLYGGWVIFTALFAFITLKSRASPHSQAAVEDADAVDAVRRVLDGSGAGPGPGGAAKSDAKSDGLSGSVPLAKTAYEEEITPSVDKEEIPLMAASTPLPEESVQDDESLDSMPASTPPLPASATTTAKSSPVAKKRATRKAAAL